MIKKVDLIQRGDPYTELTIAKTILIQEQYFYFELINGCRVTMGPACETAGVRILSGGLIELYINPEFFLSLTIYERVGLLMHEMLHLMFNHISRSRGLNAPRANVAMDNVINQMIPVKFLPTMGITPEKLSKDLNTDITKDKSFEEYYIKLQQHQDKMGGYNRSSSKDKNGQGSDGDSQGDPSQGNSQNGTGKQRGKNSSQVMDDHAFWETGIVDEELNKKVIGELVKNAVDNTKRNKPGDKSIPKDLIEEITEELKPEQVDWRIVLRHFSGSRITHQKRSTYNRPNRMLGLKAPGKKGANGPGILGAADDSGSISDDDILLMMSEMYAATKQFSENSELVFFDCDIYRDEKGEPIIYQIGGNKKPPGRPQTGGTNFQPVIDFANEYKPDVLIIFTDGVASTPTTPKCPILWIIIGGVDNPNLPGKRIVLPDNWREKKTSLILGK